MSFIVGPPSNRKNSYVLNKDGKNINIYYVDRDGNKQMKYHGSDEESLYNSLKVSRNINFDSFRSDSNVIG